MKRRREDENNPQAEPAGQPPLKQPRVNDWWSTLSGWWSALSSFSALSSPAQPQPRYLEPPTDGSPLSELPPEILAQVLSLTPLNLRLREVNRAFAESIDDVLWQQMRAKQGEEFDAQWDKQQAEIDSLQQSKESVLEIVENNPKVIGAYQKLDQITNQTTIALYAREKILNFINEAIVRHKIDTQSNRLDCTNCHLTRFPEALMEDPTLAAFWKNLSMLFLEHNQLDSLPEGLGRLAALQVLILDHNQLSSVPESLGQLTALKSLYLHHNRLDSLPESLGRLTALRWLDLSYNKLSSVPEALLGHLAALQYLCLQHNQLSSLPEALGQLTALKSLYLHHNQLSSVPESFCQLTVLETLFLEHNQLSSVPEGLDRLSALGTLRLDHNHLSELPKNLAKHILINERGSIITKEQVLQTQTEISADSEKKPTVLGRP
jgi:Leucine-rich repeat (LRR) protein